MRWPSSVYAPLLAFETPQPSVCGSETQRTSARCLYATLRSAASARAEGELLAKMDDDDFYSATHIWDLVLARMYSGAQIVGKALDWIYLTHADTTVFRPTYPAEQFAKFVAGGTMLISAGDLAQVGGWRPVPKSVDRALLDRVLDAVLRERPVIRSKPRESHTIGWSSAEMSTRVKPITIWWSSCSRSAPSHRPSTRSASSGSGSARRGDARPPP